MSNYRNHAWRHHPTKGTDPIEVPAAGGSGYTSPIVLPILQAEGDQYEGFGWTGVVVDNTVRHNAVRTNGKSRTPALNDYLTHHVVLGPQGSLWGLSVSYKVQSDGGQVTFSMASLTSPNPNRGGTSDAGTVIEAPAGSFVTMGTIDTYAAVAGDNGPSYVKAWRMMGADGDALTAFTSAGDTYTGFDTWDGGPGYYWLQAKVTGKNASSSGYRAELTGIAFLRLNDYGEL